MQLKLVICGFSSEYGLAEVVAYLEVPVNEWFDMSEDERNGYVQEFNKMTIEDAIKRKTKAAIHVPTAQVSEGKCYSPLKTGQMVWLPLLSRMWTSCLTSKMHFK